MRVCSICRHPERKKIEALRASGVHLVPLAEQYGVGTSQLSRHMANHVTPSEMTAYLCGASEVEALRRLAARENGTILEDLQLAKAMCFRQMHEAATVKDGNRFATLAGRFLDILERLGERTGEISRLNPAIVVNNDNRTISITTTPQFIRLQRGLMQLCLDHPEMRGDIAKMLKDCEADERAGRLVAIEHADAA